MWECFIQNPTHHKSYLQARKLKLPFKLLSLTAYKNIPRKYQLKQISAGGDCIEASEPLLRLICKHNIVTVLYKLVYKVRTDTECPSTMSQAKDKYHDSYR